jgi:hypothetical protein
VFWSASLAILYLWVTGMPSVGVWVIQGNTAGYCNCKECVKLKRFSISKVDGFLIMSVVTQ